jgi:hypothetical protein
LTNSSEFFDKFFPNKRHSNITVIYGTQVIQYMLQSIKANTNFCTIIGDMPHNDCSVAYNGLRQISTYFKSFNSFLKFIDCKNDIFKEYVINIYSRKLKNANYLLSSCK